MTETHFIAHCPTCGASWDIDFEPQGCTCDYSDPDVPIAPWTMTVEAA